MSGQEVAKQVFTAIETNQFYILTHYEEHKVLIENRMNSAFFAMPSMIKCGSLH